MATTLADLRNLRISRLLTQAALAAKAGVSRATVQGIESGRYVPSDLVRERLAQALEVSRHEIAWPEEAA